MNTINHTFAEILNDAKIVDTDTKKEFAQKYGIKSNKTDEIRHLIYGVALEIVRQKQDGFTQDDVTVWSRYYNTPESAQKIKSSLDTMNIEFVKFVTETRRKFDETHPRQARFTARVTKMYQKYLTARLESTDDVLEQIFKNLMSLTSEFHKTYIEHTLEASKKMFDFMLQYKEIKTTADAYKFFNLPKSPEHWRDERGLRTPEYLKWDKKRLAVEKNYYKICAFREYSGNFSLEIFLANEKDRIEKDFEQNMRLIAKRIKTAGMSIDDIKVDQIYDGDAKAFDIYISDKIQRMHARSIFCAEYSSIVTPHWRFIITNA